MELAIIKPDNVYTANGVTVKQYFATAHNPNGISLPSKRTLPLIGVTVHNTNDINEARQTTDPEQYVRATLNDRMGTVRVHFYVDDDEIWQMLPLDWQSWHAGQAGKGDRNGSAAGNGQTISIECIMDGSRSEKDKRAEDNCARLVAWLLKQHGMNTKENLFTHNYWCNVRNGRKGTIDELNRLYDGYKGCPAYIRPHWSEFVAAVDKYMKGSAEKSSVSAENGYYTVQVGAFGVKGNAENRLKEAQQYFPDAFVSFIEKRMGETS